MNGIGIIATLGAFAAAAAVAGAAFGPAASATPIANSTNGVSGPNAPNVVVRPIERGLTPATHLKLRRVACAVGGPRSCFVPAC